MGREHTPSPAKPAQAQSRAPARDTQLEMTKVRRESDQQTKPITGQRRGEVQPPQQGRELDKFEQHQTHLNRIEYHQKGAEKKEPAIVEYQNPKRSREGEVQCLDDKNSEAIRATLQRSHEKFGDYFAVSGNQDFRRQAWLHANQMGMRVGGYAPTEGDKQALEQLKADYGDEGKVQRKVDMTSSQSPDSAQKPFISPDQRQERIRARGDLPNAGEVTKSVNYGAGLQTTTVSEYRRKMKRYEEMQLDQVPPVLEGRAQELSRSAWKTEKAAVQHTAQVAQKDAISPEQNQVAGKVVERLKGMSYGSLPHNQREKQRIRAKSGVTPGEHKRLVAASRENGEDDLADSLEIANVTGLRPAELQKGVTMETNGQRTAMHIQGAKKTEVKPGDDSHFNVKKGADRVFVTESPEIAEIAKRRNGYFKPSQNESAMGGKLDAVREKAGISEASFYSYRNQIKTDMEVDGFSRKEIKIAMGHQSEKTQDTYGVK